MWTEHSEQLADRRAIKVAIDENSTPMTFEAVLGRWQRDAGFRAFFNDLLADSPFTAFKWETPPITAATANRPFEFVMLDSPGLARASDTVAFAEHFDSEAPGGVVAFANLGGDAQLVVPCPMGSHAAYGHIGAFVRLAPEAQQQALWSRVGTAMQRRLGAEPVWLSTAGGGVSWLHVRLDDRPKYYGYAPYRTRT